jgi:uncharacterized RDD family membrane protein YckC
MTAEDYVTQVLSALPDGVVDRDSIAMELRGHIAERVGEGQPLGEVLARLGDPVALAASYGGAVPLEPAPHGPRLGAKLVDAGLAASVAATLALAGATLAPTEDLRGALVVAALLFGVAGFWAGTAWAEYRFGATPGKRVFGLRVVSEAGTRISPGAAAVRQLPLLLQVFWIDAGFALFTERRQRAFELLSRTRVVRG